QVNPLAVNRKLDLMLCFETANDIQIRAIEVGLKDVLTIQRKVMTDSRAASYPQRHALEVLVLRQILPNAVGFASSGDMRIADGQCPDFHCSDEVPLLQQG